MAQVPKGLQKVERFFNLEFEDQIQLSKSQKDKPDDIWLQRGKTLRRLVGVLGMVLPFTLFLYLLIFEGVTEPLSSISHYYYTRAGTIFTVVLSLLAVFLILYKTEHRLDFYLSTIAGLAALVVALVPTSNLAANCTLCDSNPHHMAEAVTFIAADKLLPWLHYGAAAVFFLSLAAMLFFLFTNKNYDPIKLASRKKTINLPNLIFRSCAIGIVLSILVIAYFSFFTEEDPAHPSKITFWMEAVAIECFGFAWFVKSEPWQWTRK
ncbi:MAG: hypothetical protein ABJM06_12345 [Gilvibacter sp.]